MATELEQNGIKVRIVNGRMSGIVDDAAPVQLTGKASDLYELTVDVDSQHSDRAFFAVVFLDHNGEVRTLHGRRVGNVLIVAAPVH